MTEPEILARINKLNSELALLNALLVEMRAQDVYEIDLTPDFPTLCAEN